MHVFHLLLLLSSIYIFAACSPRINVGYTNAYKRYTDNIEHGFIQHPAKKDTYYCKFEVTNWEYNLFLNSIKSEDAQLWEKCKHQTKLPMQQSSSKHNPYTHSFHSNPWYQDHPIVNISHFGALEYCKWLTQFYNKLNTKKYKEVIFRLPKKVEYEFLFSIIEVDIIPVDKTNVNAYLCNLAYNGKAAIDGSEYSNRVFEYIQTDNGYCSIIGNASEMTMSGEQTGGSWDSNPAEVKLFKAIDGASPELGFRIVLEVLEK